MPWSESLPQFSLAGTLLTVLLLFFAGFGEPLLGRRAFAWLSRRRDGDERALGLLYAVTMAIHVLWGLMVLVVLLLSPALNLVDLGMRTPDAFGPIVGAAIGGTIALAAFWVLVNGLPTKGRLPLMARRSERGPRQDGDRTENEPEDGSGGRRRGSRGGRGSGHRGRRGAATPVTLPEPGHRQYLLLPRTRRERWLAAGMAVTGGVFAELLYRGLFITLVASMGVPLWGAAALSILLFAVAHAYQGWWGLLSAGFSGTLFTVLYLGTGSLVVPVLVHVALNLRSVVFPPAADRAAAEEAYYSDDYGDEYEDEYGDEYDEDYGRTGEFDAVENAEEAVPGTSGTEEAHAPQGAAEDQGYPVNQDQYAPQVPPAPQGPPTLQPPLGYQGAPQNPDPYTLQGPPGYQASPGAHAPSGPQEPYVSQGSTEHQWPPAPQGPPAPQPPPGYQGAPRNQDPYAPHGLPGSWGTPRPQGPHTPQGPPANQSHQGPFPPGPAQYGPQGRPYPGGAHSGSQRPPAPQVPGRDPGEFPSGPGADPLSGPYPGHGGDQSGRRLYPDEWIDRYHGPEDDTPGPDSPYRD